MCIRDRRYRGRQDPSFAQCGRKHILVETLIKVTNPTTCLRPRNSVRAVFACTTNNITLFLPVLLITLLCFFLPVGSLSGDYFLKQYPEGQS